MSTPSIALDQTSLAAGAPEELAGPPHRLAPVASPVTREERISSIDTLRGFALLGILAMNITSFGLPAWAYNVPLSTPLPVFHGPHWRANTVTWFLRWILFEGKMRAIFSMLFGAGVILLTSRAEARGAGERTADIFLRRNMWLVLIGFLHCYLIWEGDILYLYGMMGLLFLFPMRKLQPRTLLRAGTLVLLFNSLLITGGMAGRAYHLRNQATAAHKVELSGRPLTADQGDDLKNWSDLQDDWRPPQKKVDEDLKAMRGGYLSAQGHRAKHALDSETLFLYFGFGDVLGFMLLGMGLYKNGFLTAKLSDRTYSLTALIGLGIAWPLSAVGCYEAWHSHFDIFTTGWWLFTPFDLTRAGGAFGLAALLLLVLKHGLLKPLTRPLAAVGQMALSNYILTSITCKLLFVWSPLHWYGRLEFFELYLVVAAICASTFSGARSGFATSTSAPSNGSGAPSPTGSANPCASLGPRPSSLPPEPRHPAVARQPDATLSRPTSEDCTLRNMFALRICCGCLALTLFTPLLGQTAQTSDAVAPYRLTIPVDEVLLTFHAADLHGLPINTLTLGQLQLLDNGKPPRSVLAFDLLQDSPIRAGFLVDTSTSMRDSLPAMRAISIHYAQKLLRQNSDQAFVAEFARLSKLLQPWTANASALSTSLRSIKAGDGNRIAGTSIFDAVYHACYYQFGAIDHRVSGNFLLLFTDGEDNGSSIALKDAVATCQRTNTTIYAVRAAKDSALSSSGAATLAALTSETGGRVFRDDASDAEIDDDLRLIEADLRNQYRLVYRPAALQHDGTFHRITLEAPELLGTITVRSGYYAPAP